MGKCGSKMTTCFEDSIGDQNNDGVFNGQDVAVATKSALDVVVGLSQQLIAVLGVFATVNADDPKVAADLEEAINVLNVIVTSSNAAKSTVDTVAKIKIPKNLHDVNGDGKIDLEDYVSWYLQEAIGAGLNVSNDIEKIMSSLEKSGVNLGESPEKLNKVKKVLTELDRMKAEVKLVTTAHSSTPQQRINETVATPAKPRV